MYVAVKGGSEQLKKRTSFSLASGGATIRSLRLHPPQIEEQLSLGVARVMAEGSLYDPGLAAIAINRRAAT